MRDESARSPDSSLILHPSSFKEVPLRGVEPPRLAAAHFECAASAIPPQGVAREAAAPRVHYTRPALAGQGILSPTQGAVLSRTDRRLPQPVQLGAESREPGFRLLARGRFAGRPAGLLVRRAGCATA